MKKYISLSYVQVNEILEQQPIRKNVDSMVLHEQPTSQVHRIQYVHLQLLVFLRVQ